MKITTFMHDSWKEENERRLNYFADTLLNMSSLSIKADLNVHLDELKINISSMVFGVWHVMVTAS